jgi:hypothetical protein
MNLLFKKTTQGATEAVMRALIKKVLPGFYLSHKPPKGLVRVKKVKTEETTG